MATAGVWEKLSPPLSESTLQVLHETLSFDTMTPVQAAAIPLMLSHKDVAVEACTGSGKTLAFVIPIVEMILRLRASGNKLPNGVLALVILPIRELALQVHGILSHFSSVINVPTSLLIGGGQDDSFEEEFGAISKAKIVVGTPGRLEFSIVRQPDQTRPLLDCRNLEVLILDEADRLLDMGFERSINSILQCLPKQRRTGLFSATQTSEVLQLVRAGLRNPVRIEVKVQQRGTKEQQRVPNTLSNYFAICESDERLSQLVAFMLKHRDSKIIVFFLTCASVNFFWKALKSLEEFQDYPLYSLHGKIPAKKRNVTFSHFVEAASGCLFTTDVAARGLDIPEIDWIIQLDAPQDPNVCVHRIGRTARMGKEGSALLFLSRSESSYIELLAGRKVPAVEYALDPDAPNVLDRIRDITMTQRELMEKAQIAFVSFIRAYKEHQCRYIFPFQQLNLGRLARAYCLLKLPRMPETKGREAEIAEFFTPADIDLDSVPYADKQREKIRQKKLTTKPTLEDIERQAERERQRLDRTPWSKSNTKKRKREEDKISQKEKRQKLLLEQEKAERDKQAEWDELAREARLIKKEKKSKRKRKHAKKSTDDAADDFDDDED